MKFLKWIGVITFKYHDGVYVSCERFAWKFDVVENKDAALFDQQLNLDSGCKHNEWSKPILKPIAKLEDLLYGFSADNLTGWAAGGVGELSWWSKVFLVAGSTFFVSSAGLAHVDGFLFLGFCLKKMLKNELSTM